MHPADQISAQFRLSRPVLTALKKLGIHTVRDLLYHFPARYDQGGDESSIAGLVAGSSATLYGTIHKLDTRKSWKRRIPVGEAQLRDASGSIKIMWFHQPYMAKKFAEGMFVKATGTIGGKDGKLYLANPEVEQADPTEVQLFVPQEQKQVSALFAVYPESRGVSSLWFRHAIDRVFKASAHSIDDPIPPDILTRYKLPSLATALIWIHTPEKLQDAETARKRFAFEEMFAIQVQKARERAENDASTTFPILGKELADTFLSSIPFPPTGAQKKAIQEILTDFKKKHPMARLLEGDVGSGKTLVAAATAYAVVNSRPPERQSGTLQVAYMAPTEILAQQHFEYFIEYFKDLPINIALMTGSGCKKFPSKAKKGAATDISRAQLLKWVANGEIAMLVGTHALIQKSVQFKHLAYCIVDEQHRFGTRQRAALLKKQPSHAGNAALRHSVRDEDFVRSEASPAGTNTVPEGRCQTLPHFLSMTATPIPRTLALTMYGDLDVSLLDELPPGRIRITTHIVRKEQRSEAYKKIQQEIEKGRQAYVICPRIEEPDPAKENAVQAKSAKAEAARLQKEVFPQYTVGLLHGAMKPAEKNTVMEAFSSGKIHILVATSVVEVGVNVPNATIILIEGAERFGLAQLHQLRGRVQRSSHPPTCLLLPETTGTTAMQRLRALESSSDGFKLAETDLKNRGTGDLWGMRQSGMSDLGMEALKNLRLVQAARTEAMTLIAEDPQLTKHTALRARILAATSTLHEE